MSTGTAGDGDGQEVVEAHRSNKLPLSNNNSDGVNSIAEQITAEAAEAGSSSAILTNGLVPIPSASHPNSHVQAFRFHIAHTRMEAGSNEVEATPNGRAARTAETGADASASADVDMKEATCECDADLPGETVQADGDAGGAAGSAGGDARKLFASDALAYLPVRPGVALRAPLTVQLTLIPVDQDHYAEHSPASDTIPTALAGAQHFNSASVVASS